MKKHISEKVLEKIKDENVKMKPRGYFRAYSLAWLAISGLLFVLATLMVSIIIYHVANIYSLNLITQKPFLILSVFPYFLFAVAVLLMFFVSRTYRKSRNTCRHEEWMLFAVLIFGVLLIGFSMHSHKFNRLFWHPLEKNNVYQKVVVTPRSFWSKPQKGTLSGMVISKKNGVVILKTWDGKKWKVTIPNKQKTHSGMIAPRSVIKMVGELENGSHFTAQKVWQWQ